MRRLVLVFVSLISISCMGQDLPWYVDSVTVTPPGTNGIGSVRLAGTWLDTCIPDAVSHRTTGDRVDLSLSVPIINVGCGDALTPWSLTEEFQLTDSRDFSIFGSLVAVDPNDRGIRDPLEGPDLLYRSAVPTASFEGLSNPIDGYVTRAHDVSSDGRVVTGAIELDPYSSGFITSEAFRWSERQGLQFAWGLARWHSRW